MSTLIIIRYADDTVLIADSEEKLQRLVDTVNNASNRKGLQLNISNTKTMVISKSTDIPICNITIQNQVLKQVHSFVYWGSTITQDGRCNKEIEKRIAIANRTFNSMINIFRNLNINIHTRVRTMKAYIWSTLTYGCETWTISGDFRMKLEALEMWLFRKMLRIPWTARITNERVLEMINSRRSLVVTTCTEAPQIQTSEPYWKDRRQKGTRKTETEIYREPSGGCQMRPETCRIPADG